MSGVRILGIAEAEPEIREEIQQYVAALRGVPETGAGEN